MLPYLYACVATFSCYGYSRHAAYLYRFISEILASFTHDNECRHQHHMTIWHHTYVAPIYWWSSMRRSQEYDPHIWNMTWCTHHTAGPGKYRDTYILREQYTYTFMIWQCAIYHCKRIYTEIDAHMCAAHLVHDNIYVHVCIYILYHPKNTYICT